MLYGIAYDKLSNIFLSKNVLFLGHLCVYIG